jgi:hypothetical protein
MRPRAALSEHDLVFLVTRKGDGLADTDTASTPDAPRVVDFFVRRGCELIAEYAEYTWFEPPEP